MTPLRIFQYAQEGCEIGIPSNPETVFPAAKDRVPGFEFQVRLSFVAPEARGTDVANVVDEIRVQTPHLQRYIELSKGGGSGLVVLRCGPLDAIEIGF